MALSGNAHEVTLKQRQSSQPILLWRNYC